MREVTIEEQAENANNLQFGDDRLGVQFFMQSIEDKERTLAEGRKCFREREFVKIMVPGDRHNVIVRPVQVTGVMPTDDRMRFPRHYEAFKAKQDQKAHDGTPLALWPAMPDSTADELKYLNVFTVEQLATIADTHIGKIPNGQNWKSRAVEFLKVIGDQAALNKLNLALAERDSKIATQQLAIDDQAAIIAKLSKRLDKLEK
jgi:hypothetical protein